MPKTTTTKTTSKRPPAKKVNKLFLNIDALPDIMTVNDMKEFAGYGINQCYEHCRTNQFRDIVFRKNNKTLVKPSSKQLYKQIEVWR